MSADTLFVFLLIAASAVAMASNRVRFDVVALLVVAALMVSGILTPNEALAGFGSTVVILVACLLVVGEMLDRTGVAMAMGDLILKKGGKDETRLLVVIMAGAAVLGAVMSSTAVVAIFIPIVLRVASETGLSASRLLMPLSFAALISGMLTLIATPPNLVVNEELKGAGYDGFGFFGFTAIGIAVLGIAIVYILFIGRRLLPGSEAGSAGPGEDRRSMLELWDKFQADHRFGPERVDPDSVLVGKTLAEADLEGRYGVTVLGIQKEVKGRREPIASPHAGTEVRAGDILMVLGETEALKRVAAEEGLSPHASSVQERQRWYWEMGGAGVLIHPESNLIGRRVDEIDFRARYGVDPAGLRRNGEAVPEFREAKLASSDSLLVVGRWKRIEHLRTRNHDFVVVETPSEEKQVVPAYRNRNVSLILLGAMVLLSVLNVIPLIAVVLLTALAAVLSRCLTMEECYRSIHWSSLVLVAGMLPLADALDQTGGTDLVVETIMNLLGDGGPRLMLTLLFFLTATLSMFLSNTASAVLVAPIAISAAEALGVSPYPLALAVVMGASAAFATPVSTPVVTLVVDPGRYQFMDFVKVGSPLIVLTYFGTLLVVPLLFPF